MADIVLDALIDVLKLLPILVPMYILIEIIERRGLKFFVKPLSSKWSVVAGAGVGLIPQCGFSIVSSKLYVKRLIPLGALVAIFIVSSDEAIPILLSRPLKLLPLLGIKVVMALVAGFAITLIGALREKKDGAIKNEKITSASVDVDFCSFGCHKHEIGECDEDEHKRSFFRSYVLHPLIHILTVFLFIFAVNIIFGLIIDRVGEESLNSFLSSHEALTPLFAAIVGLIPNCASSVVISQMYALGQLNLAAAVAGLSVNAGVAYIILIKEGGSRLKSLYIIGGIFAYSVAFGMIIYFLGSVI